MVFAPCLAYRIFWSAYISNKKHCLKQKYKYERWLITMKKVEIRSQGAYIGTTEMTFNEIRKAENAGFTVISK